MSIWAYLLHIGYNFWSDRECPEWNLTHVSAKPYLRCEDTLWNDILTGLQTAGANMVVLDLGEGVQYKSHPEIACENAWTVERLKDELAKMRSMGLEPIPKLNFSAAHDAWLGKYSHCLCTPEYYQVVRDLIQEVAEIFDKPRFFHIGMDEETYGHQAHYAYSQVRQYDLWWQDVYYYIAEVEAVGARPWVWSDYIWHHPEWYLEKMPKSVLQSNWYYAQEFGPEVPMANAYVTMEKHGYDQIPTGSNWSTPDNFAGTVKFAHEQIAPERLLGFMQSVWRPTLEDCRQRHMDAIAQLADAKRKAEAGEL